MNNFKKTIAMIMCLVLSLGSLAYAEDVMLISAPIENDYEGHWAQVTIQKWMDEGRVSGYPDGSYKPDNNVTRAEFVKMVNGIIDFNGKGKVTYNDVLSTEWFYDYISVAQEIGYISGYSDNIFGPNDYITREQAASILSRIQYLNNNASGAEIFNDKDSISSWAIESVGAATEAGFIKGYEGNFNPLNNLTRAEALTMLNNVLENAKNVVIYNNGSELKDVVVEGDLIIAKTVGEGDVYLTNLEVSGDIKVYGGGVNSIYFNNVKVAKISLEKDKVRLVFDDGSVVEEVAVSSQTILVNENGEIAKITVAEDGSVTLSGYFEEVIILGNANITLNDAVIDKLVVNSPIELLGEGTIKALEANADGIEYEGKVKIDKVTLGEGVTKEPVVIKEETSSSSPSPTPSPTPEPGLAKDFKLVVEASVSKTTNLGTDSENTVTKSIKYPSSNFYKGSKIISEVIGDEIQFIIDKVEANDVSVIANINEILTPILDELNTKLSDIQLIEIIPSKEDVYTNDGALASVKWDIIESYLEGSSIVLPSDLKEKDGDFDVNDVLSVLSLYDSSKIESDLTIIKNNLSDVQELSIIPMTWPEEGEILSLQADMYAYILLNEMVDNILSNDLLYTLEDEYVITMAQDDEDTKYEVIITFKAVEAII